MCVCIEVRHVYKIKNRPDGKRIVYFPWAFFVYVINPFDGSI